MDASWNADEIESMAPTPFGDIVVYSRDWTVETICRQIELGNIDLNPRFQRRNAWTDERRSMLIESLIVGIPVPEVVLAEHPNKKKSFIVIDGKQRLLALSGFINASKVPSWDRPKLRGLLIKSDLNGRSYQDLEANEGAEISRRLMNADIRCTVISNFRNDDVLYQIFYRLNTGSVPLSTQELRQSLIRGDFANYLVDYTNTIGPIHAVLGLDEPDARMRDVELLLRLMALMEHAAFFRGDLKKFLDSSMQLFSNGWPLNRPTIEGYLTRINTSVARLFKAFDKSQIGRKMTGTKFESRFNKAIFEVEVLCFDQLSDTDLTPESISSFHSAIKVLFEKHEFRSSIEATTKTLSQYRTRFEQFSSVVQSVFGKEIRIPSFPLE
jgi:hypothetical protein